MTQVKIKYATGGYYWTTPYGKVKVLGGLPGNRIRVQLEDETVLDLTCIYTAGNAINVSKVETVDDEGQDEQGSGSESGSGSVNTVL